MPNLCGGICAPLGYCFCSCTPFWNQVQVLQWKNRQIRLRRWKLLALEVIVPLMLVLALGGLRALIKPVTINEDIPSLLSQTGALWDNQYLYPPQGSGENLVFRCLNPKANRQEGYQPYFILSTMHALKQCEMKKIAIVAGSTTAQATAQAMNKQFNDQYGKNINSTFRNPVTGVTYSNIFNFDSFVYYPSLAAFETYIKDPNYIFNYDAETLGAKFPLIGAAVVINSGYPAWDYSVRLNVTTYRYGSASYLGTNPLDVDNSIQTNQDYATNFGSYADWHFGTYYVQLTDVINTFISSDACQRQGNCPSGAGVPGVGGKSGFRFFTTGGATFPSPETIQLQFFSLIGSVFSLLIIIGLSYPNANIVSALCKEKESKIREGMKMMAMKTEALWLSWWFHFLEFFFVLSILLAIFAQMLFKNSNSFYVFLFFFLFLVSSTAFSIFVSNFFTNSRTAVIANFILYIGGYFIFIGIESQATTPSRGSRLAACLHPATALSYATFAFNEYEDSGLGVTAFTAGVSSKYNITFNDCVGFMILDSFYLSFLAWYVDKIWPSEYGTQEPWYFLFTLNYWLSVGESFFGSIFSKKNCGRVNKNYAQVVASSDEEEGEKETELAGNGVAAAATPSSDPNVEEVDPALHSQLANKKCVFIQSLYKDFMTPQGFLKVAVDNLNLTMYSGQITALLGHNGAGKTTTIAMLTGLLPVGRGDAFVEGLSVSNDMDEIRRNLGVCPQHDILFPDLTVLEHLVLFATFKGMKGNAIMVEAEKMIQSVGLTEKRHVYASMLSGGQKRKLSVGIAFIGGSRIVFLDEPTSGMDPYSRRFTWNVIRQHREGRVIVLTTHFMDEADLLGDRIAIMGDGRLLCCGSALFLKQRFGVGYNITLEKRSGSSFNSAKMINTVMSRISDARLLTDVGTEMSFQLPFTSSNKFQDLFVHMDGNLDDLGLLSYGVSVTTLEEVFIKITRSTHTLQEAQTGKEKLSSTAAVETQPLLAAAKEEGDLERQGVGNGEDSIQPTLSNALPFRKIDENDHLRYFLRHMQAILSKRFIYFIRDKKAILFVLVLPFLLLLFGEILLTSSDSEIPDSPAKVMTWSVYNSRIQETASTNVLPTLYAKNSTVCQYWGCNKNGWCYPPGNTKPAFNPRRLNCSQDLQTSVFDKFMASVGGASGSKFPVKGIESINSIYLMSKYLYKHRSDHAASHFGAFSFVNESASSYAFSVKLGFVLHTNYTAVYGVPIFGAMLADAVTKSFDPSTSIKVTYHPMPYTYLEHRFDNLNLIYVSIFLLIAVPFIPAAAASFVVREKEAKSKHQQMVSGVGIVAYWVANFVWDNTIYMVTLFLFIALIAGPAFGEQACKLGGNGCMYELQYLFGLLYLFGFSMFGFTYLISFLFKTPANALTALIFIVFLMGCLLGILGSFLLRVLPATKDYYKDIIRYVFCLFPPFALADGVNSMVFIDLFSAFELKGSQRYKAGDFAISGLPLMMMAWESFAYLLLTILVEYLINVPSFLNLFVPPKALPPMREGFKDAEVLAEEHRVLSGAADESSTILIKDLKKMYSTGKYAVKGVSLGIPNGECFGLLGINGAGKSSTLSMLSGEFPPTAGEAYLAGFNLLTDIHTCRRKVGFCPQFDALFEFLTGREHLELYARIKGIVEEDVQGVVDTKIREMGLTEYANRYAGTYSGGNKRKLSVAIAMIGEPSIVFLDEPSTGMDPVARRFMWDVISAIVTKEKKCSLILTTHSMEESEALCTRIGIMVGGVLRCLGSAQRLRSAYGDGFQIEISLQLPSSEETAEREARLGWIALAPPLNQRVVSESMIRTGLDRSGQSALAERIYDPNGSGCDILYALNSSSNRTAELSLVATWWILEEQFDAIEALFQSSFGEFVLVERQSSKLRLKVQSILPDGTPRKLGSMFGVLESHKTKLKIESYSISQTSLEQIFNQFGAAQEEERGDFRSRGEQVAVAAPLPILASVATAAAIPAPGDEQGGGEGKPRAD